jgi:hypothetical protein
VPLGLRVLYASRSRISAVQRTSSPKSCRAGRRATASSSARLRASSSASAPDERQLRDTRRKRRTASALRKSKGLFPEAPGSAAGTWLRCKTLSVSSVRRRPQRSRAGWRGRISRRRYPESRRMPKAGPNETYSKPLSTCPASAIFRHPNIKDYPSECCESATPISELKQEVSIKIDSDANYGL